MIRTLATGILAALCIGQAAAQGYPNKPIRFIVGFPAGSGTDTAARFVMAKLSERLGQPVILDNRSGAGGSIGVEAIAKSPPDGYTIGFGGGGALVIAPNLRRNLPYNPLTDIAPVTNFASNPMVLAAHPSFPAANLAELIALAKAKPRTIVFGSSGNGTSMHMAGAVLNQAAGIELVHAPYKGNAPAVNDLVGGQIPIAIIDVSTAYGFIKQGRIKALGTTGSRRALAAPQIPTFGESGLQGYSVLSWYGIIAPAKTPPEIVRLLNTHLVALLQSAEVRERLLAAGPEPAPTTPEEFGNFIRSEHARWGRVIKESNIRVE